MASCKGTVLVLFLLCCSLTEAADQCHCATSSACSGYPDGTCGACEEFWSGPTCQMYNIGRGDVYETRVSDGSENSERVVDGEKSGHPGRCTAVSDESGKAASWTLILNTRHEIHGMKIYYVSDERESLEGFEVRVSAQLCKRWPAGTSIPSVLDITCDSPVSGDLVSISIPLDDDYVKTLALCEVEIFECGDFWYGDNCDNRCNCADNSEICNKRDGTCNSGTRETTRATTTTARATSTSTPIIGDSSDRGSSPSQTSTTPAPTTAEGGGQGSRTSQGTGGPQTTAAPTGQLHPSTTPQVGDGPQELAGPPSFSLGELLGVVVGAVVGVAVITAGLILLVLKKRSRNKDTEKKAPDTGFKGDGPHINASYVGYDELKAPENQYEILPCDKEEAKGVFASPGDGYARFGAIGPENQYTTFQKKTDCADPYDCVTQY